jgi:hypothetical protein
MRILALDLGTEMGWAWWNGARRESGIQTFDVRRGESPGMRYIRFNCWLSESVKWSGTGPDDGTGPQLVVYEQTHNRGGAATEVGAGFATRVQEHCARFGIQHAPIHSMHLKKFVLKKVEKGKATKADMIKAVNERWGPPFVSNDNEADAIGLLECARVEMDGAA